MTSSIIDLTHPLTAGMQVHPGDTQVRVAPATSLGNDGVAVHSLHLGTHTGTHLDAPSHSITDGTTVDTLDLERLFAPVHLVDSTSLARPGRRITVADVASQLSEIAPGSIVLFRTDWSERFGRPDYLDHPYLDAAIAALLLVAGVRVVGVDTLSPDRTGSGATPAELPFHEAFLGAGGVIIENLNRLAAIDTAKHPWLSALPLPFTGLDGSPIRAVAICRES